MSTVVTGSIGNDFSKAKLPWPIWPPPKKEKSLIDVSIQAAEKLKARYIEITSKVSAIITSISNGEDGWKRADNAQNKVVATCRATPRAIKSHKIAIECV